MKKLLLIISTITILTACSNENHDNQNETPKEESEEITIEGTNNNKEFENQLRTFIEETYTIQDYKDLTYFDELLSEEYQSVYINNNESMGKVIELDVEQLELYKSINKNDYMFSIVTKNTNNNTKDIDSTRQIGVIEVKKEKIINIKVISSEEVPLNNENEGE